MGIRTNYIDDLYHHINFKLKDVSSTLEQYGLTERGIVNLCGGIPSPDVTNIQVVITSTYSSALCAQVITDQYEVSRNMDFDIWRLDNNYMYVQDKRQGIGTNLFLNQLQTARKYPFEKLNTIATAPDDELAWDGYYFWANLGFENKDIDDYREWADAMGRVEPTLSELVQTEEGRNLWKRTGFTWIGAFYLASNHPCMDYLRRHLQRRGIDFVLEE